MSHAGPGGPVPPRGSAAGGGQLPGATALMTGLPTNSACVWVGPPLLASGPSCGSVLIRSPSAGLRPQALLLSRLEPPDVSTPPARMRQLGPPIGLATIVFLRL